MQVYATLSDNELIKLLERGEEAAFTEIYNRYWEKLLAIGLYFTHNQHEAEDIVHEVLISLWERREKLSINSLEAYLATAIKFSVFKAITRSKHRRELLENRLQSNHIHDIEEKLEARFLEEYMKGTVAQLPEKARLVFTYSRQDELTISEIARRLDLSPKAVEYHMTKALRALRLALQKIKSFFI